MQANFRFNPSYPLARRALSLSVLLSALSLGMLLQSASVALAQYDSQPYPPYNDPANAAPSDDNNNDGGNIDDYARYSEDASRMFNNGQLSQAIDLFEKALTVAPNSSIPVVYNNLAVVYIKRGNYFHDRLHQDDNALNDFRKAYFYLESAWPEGMERKPLHEKNRQVTRDNLNIAYHNLGINPGDKAKHLELAKQLRMQGKFPEAIVEYGMALDLDKKDPMAAKALGDLFTVVNMPEKSKKYYAIAAGGAASTASGLSQDDTLVQLGNAQLKTGETDKAVANFDKALAIDPTNVSALNMLEKIWLNEIKFNPASVLGHANLGSVYQKKRQFDQALQQYNAAEHFAEQDPRTPFDVKKQIRLNLGTLFQAQKRYDLALKAYDTVLQVDPNHLMANYYKATLLEESGNTDGALQAYNKVLSIDPNNKAAQDKLLALAKQQTDPAKLAVGLKQYADRFPNNATVQAQIGEEFHQRKNLNDAAYYYKRAIQLDPNLASAWANLGAVYQAQGKDEDSAEAFQKAKALDPNNTTFQELAKNAATDIGYKAYQQAVALQQQNKPQEALPYFQKALETNDTAEIRAAYGISLQSAGKLDEAIMAYQKAMSQDPGNADYAYYLGTAYHQKKDMPKAEAAYKKALSLKPDYTDAKNALASIAQQAASADLDKAIEAYNNKNYPTAMTLIGQVLVQNAEDPMAHYYKGLILDAQKKPSLAAQSYQKATQYNPQFSDAYYALGVALDNAKDSRGARSAFEKFLTLSGTNDDDFVKYARERIKTLAQQ
jgi:tetratricopeptide (TPR) repeat protein